ncbi:hypothetical protein [Geminicoccus harenae]|uniref:hypothetical protein n=1 Tax=Geminicoccus harenae TaxID=2498453 RepID=UPI00168B9D55|nr:hypothetical protein [Geminicoccus harenae]
MTGIDDRLVIHDGIGDLGIERNKTAKVANRSGLTRCARSNVGLIQSTFVHVSQPGRPQ